MGISSNQARFLALTSRQIDLEHRIQQICQRRLRLTSELENVATSYNNKISNRQMYNMNTNNSGINNITLSSINSTLDENGKRYDITAIAKAGAKSGEYSGISFSAGVGFTIWGGGSITGGGTISLINDLGLPSTASESEAIDAALRSGKISIAKVADEYTQNAVTMYDTNAGSMGSREIEDWRTLPFIADELYKGDDVDAENQYDKTVEEINSQDKKLQLEQTSIEVEYKAVTSEKESVKKILDTNAAASFKYFS